MRVHYLENSRAHRILWLIEELEIPYEVVTYRRGPDMRAPRELRQIHPLGKSPVLEDGGRIIAESGAMIEYLLDVYGAAKGLRPEPGSDALLDYRYWLHAAEGTAMPMITMKLIFTMLPARVPFLVRPLAKLIANGAQAQITDPQARDQMALWEETLARGRWFAGNAFSAADIAMSFPVEVAIGRFRLGEPGPATAAWLDAIRSRPSYLRALERGRYAIAG
ncbi:glutathione S-transferase family protein [Roseibium aestuarii]|uniref:Glutathione S-transferase family protein n=1 Tax=Roseibium aestuarii TaxID=2600299 RepID=A0ABW4JR36_9HYPH|nr:glutathione S-transferase [Roseibium aestuarii]